MSDTETVFVFCPCCCTSLDAGTSPGPQEFECDNCGQAWTAELDAERFAQFNIA